MFCETKLASRIAITRRCSTKALGKHIKVFGLLQHSNTYLSKRTFYGCTLLKTKKYAMSVTNVLYPNGFFLFVCLFVFFFFWFCLFCFVLFCFVLFCFLTYLLLAMSIETTSDYSLHIPFKKPNTNFIFSQTAKAKTVQTLFTLFNSQDSCLCNIICSKT